MAFLGSIAGPLRKILAKYANEVRYPVLLPCAGNFTVGSALRSGGYKGRISGCDITLYTSALGAALAGDNLDVFIKEDCPEQLRNFIDVSSPIRFCASVSLMLDLRQVWKNKNIWHRRTLTNTSADWKNLMAKTMQNFEKYAAHMKLGEGFQYKPFDAVDFLNEHDKEHAVFIAPPTFGSKDYINQEKMLAASVDWKAPTYQEISFKDVEIYEKITSFAEWMIIMERPLPEIEKILGEPVAVVHKGRKSVTYAYGHSKQRVVTRAYLPSKNIPAPLSGDTRFSGEEKVGLIFLDKKQSVRMNQHYMSTRVDYYLADVALSIGLMVGGKIIGKLDYNLTKHNWALPDKRLQIYQRSDLAVPSAEKRLAKLVLLFSQSHEVKKLIDDTFKDNYSYTVTTAFSKNPVSMKYRGIYKLHKKIPDEEQEGFRLNYYGELGLYSLEEAFKLWLKKYRK